jgi:ADP-ribosyl-[dinitrogen reductase] hydrolase
MQEIGRKYPNCGYGRMFSKWVFSDDPQPYNSFGNGAAMRISPVGFAARTKSEACRLSEVVTGVTHDHEEGIKGAEATAVAIYMARRGFTKGEIREKIERNYYSLDFTIDDIRDSHQFNETCQDTIPQAIEAFLESTSFEDAIRNAISIGGDSDTLAAITGAIAEAYYGVPEELKEIALSYLNDELRSIFNDWSEFIGNEGAISKFKVLTKYIGRISKSESYGEWFIDRENDGTSEHPIQMPYVNFNELVDLFVTEFYQFSKQTEEQFLLNTAMLEKSAEESSKQFKITTWMTVLVIILTIANLVPTILNWGGNDYSDQLTGIEASIDGINSTEELSDINDKLLEITDLLNAADGSNADARIDNIIELLESIEAQLNDDAQ